MKRRIIDSGRDWLVLIACFCMNILNAGYIKCFGILFVEVEKEFQTSASMTSLLMGVNAAAYSVTAFIVLNFVLEWISLRKTTILGVMTLSTGVLINCFAESINILIISQGILAGAGAAMLYGPGLVHVSKYFKKRRAMATAICSCGVSAGGMLLPPFVQFLISEYGLRGAFLIISGMMLQILVFVSLYRPLAARNVKVAEDGYEKHDELSTDASGLCDQNQSANEKIGSSDEYTESDAFLETENSRGMESENNSSKTLSAKNLASENKKEDFVLQKEISEPPKIPSSVTACIKNMNLSFFKRPLYLLIFGFTACGFLGVGLFQTFLPPLAKEKGLSKTQAALLLTTFNGLELISRLLASFLAEVPFIKRFHLIAISMLLLGTLNQLTMYISNFILMVSYVAVFGILNGVYPALHPAVIIDFVGMEDFSKVFGFVQVFHGAMMTACYPLMGALRDLTGSYSASFHFLGACKLMSAIFLLLLPFTERKHSVSAP